MSKEIEKRFYTFDRKILNDKINELGGIKKGMFNFQIMTFIPPEGYSVLRLRDEGHRVTFTLKQKGSDGYELENEVIVNNFNEMKTILEKMGNKKKYFIQKIREIYNIGNSELVFDHYPGLPGYIEIESSSEEELFNLADKLGLVKDEPHRDAGDLYFEIYGITKDRPLLDLAFENIHDLFKKYITKNEDMMLKIIEGQKKLLEKINI
jgi:adenylate cyclase class 2|uniref:CYTH domain-containing protein n=1 Tax=viral metagenome TaxID=1070528 RepID=A0A6C0GZD7_9ZZZZ